jgi:hypothetical protein
MALQLREIQHIISVKHRLSHSKGEAVNGKGFDTGLFQGDELNALLLTDNPKA